VRGTINSQNLQYFCGLAPKSPLELHGTASELVVRRTKIEEMHLNKDSQVTAPVHSVYQGWNYRVCQGKHTLLVLQMA